MIPAWVRGALAGIVGDFKRFHRTYHRQRPALAALPIFLLQPSSGALLLMRLAASAPKPISVLVRRRLLRRFGTDVEHGARLAPGLLLAHATGMVIGGDVALGPGVKLHQHVTLGQHRGGCPELEADVYVMPGATIVGPVCVGRGAVVGAGAYVCADVPSGAVVPALTRWTRSSATRPA
jgi:serine acetyltransferase